MTIEEKNRKITERMDDLKLSFGNGKFWSRNYNIPNDPSKVSDTEPTHVVEVNAKGEEYKPHYTSDGSCGCNCFNSAIQCHGFALYMAYRIFGTRLYISDDYAGETNKVIENSGGWVVHTRGNLDGISLEPGDIIRSQDPTYGWHTGIVWKLDGNVVYFAEVWGSQSSKIAWGGWNGRDVSDTETKVDALKSRALYIVKSPKTVYEGELDPNPDSDTGGDDSGTTTEPETETVTVSFYDDLPENGGKYIDSKTYDVGGTYKSVGFPSPTTPTGYKFDHWWFPAPNGYGYVETWSPVTKDITELYAHWDRDTVEVTFYDDLEVNGGQVVDTRDYLVGLKYNAEYLKNSDNTFPDPTNFPKTGYSFDSWHTDTGGYVEHYSYVKRDRTELYANWTPNTYDVTLYNNDGTNVSNTESFVFGGTYGEKLGALEDRYGYTFKEWNTQSNGEGDSYDKNSKIEAKNLDLYAIWEEKEVNVTYNYGYDVNGTVKTGEGTLNYGDTYAEATGTNVPNMTGLEHPTGGYEFAGWHHDVVESSDKVVMDADHTLTAMWEPKKIYVTFRPDDTNSFKYPISPIQVRYGEKFDQLPVPDPVLPYEFIGWTLSEDGESTGTYVDDFEDVYFTEDITLMANWSSRRFTRFIYENENGEETTKGCSQMYGYAYRGVPTIPEKDGYTSKWVFSEEGSLYNGSAFFPGMLVIPDHPITIRAVYTAVTTD